MFHRQAQVRGESMSTRHRLRKIRRISRTEALQLMGLHTKVIQFSSQIELAVEGDHDTEALFTSAKLTTERTY